MPTFGLYEYKVEGRAVGFNRKRGLSIDGSDESVHVYRLAQDFIAR